MAVKRISRAFKDINLSFEPQGVTCNLTLGESHLSCHTWPEKGCVAFDIFTCGAKNPRCVAWWVLEYFDTDDYIMKDFAR